MNLGDGLSALRCPKEILDDCEEEDDPEEDEHPGEGTLERLLLEAKSSKVYLRYFAYRRSLSFYSFCCLHSSCNCLVSSYRAFTFYFLRSLDI